MNKNKKYITPHTNVIGAVPQSHLLKKSDPKEIHVPIGSAKESMNNEDVWGEDEE